MSRTEDSFTLVGSVLLMPKAADLTAFLLLSNNVRAPVSLKADVVAAGSIFARNTPALADNLSESSNLCLTTLALSD